MWKNLCQYVWNKNIIPWKVLEWFLFTSCDTAKTHSFATLTFSFFFMLSYSWIKIVSCALYGIISLYQQVKLTRKKPCHLQLFSFNICICCNKGKMVDRLALKICWLKKFVYSQLMTKYCPGLFYIAPSSLIKFVIMLQFFYCPGTCFSNVPVT